MSEYCMKLNTLSDHVYKYRQRNVPQMGESSASDRRVISDPRHDAAIQSHVSQSQTRMCASLEPTITL